MALDYDTSSKSNFLLLPVPEQSDVFIPQKKDSSLTTITPPLFSSLTQNSTKSQHWIPNISDVGTDSIVKNEDLKLGKMNLLQSLNELVRTEGVVTGMLTGVNFEDRKLEILYPASNKKLYGYFQDISKWHFRSELVQVVGTVVQDSKGEPHWIDNVQDVLEIDLSPITVDQVPYEDGQLIAQKPIALIPTLSETKQFYVIEKEELGISLIAYTRTELKDLLYEEFAFLWHEYAKEEDDNMTVGAQALKGRLLKVFEERI